MFTFFAVVCQRAGICKTSLWKGRNGLMRSTTLGRARGIAAAATFAITSLLTTTGQSGLTINLTFDNSFKTNFAAGGLNETDAENAAKYAAQQFENTFTNNVVLNITVAGASSTTSTVFGQSQFSQYANNSYLS